MAPGEDFVFFYKVQDSALFYTNRRAVVLNNQDELITYLTSHEKAFCIVDKKRYFQKLDKLKKISTVLDREGSKLLISANTSAWKEGG
jgi:predicted Zn-ribbon and HTH transcriptional regulator